MTVSLGCEKLQPSLLFPDVDLPELVRFQDPAHSGFDKIVRSLMETAKTHLERLNVRHREPVPVSELVVGMQCGGSDAFSGVTANPALGVASDMIVASGGTTLFADGTMPTSPVAASTVPPIPHRATRRVGCPTSPKRRWDRSSNLALRPSTASWHLARAPTNAVCYLPQRLLATSFAARSCWPRARGSGGDRQEQPRRDGSAHICPDHCYRIGCEDLGRTPPHAQCVNNFQSSTRDVMRLQVTEA